MQTRVPFVWFSELSQFSMISFCNNIEQSNDALIIYVFFFRTMVVHITLNIFFPHNEGLNILNNVFASKLACILNWMWKVWLHHSTNRASFFCLFERGGEEEAPPEWRQTLEVTAAQTSGLNQSFVKLVYSSASTRYVTTEPAVASALLYPSNMPRMLNKDLILQSLSQASFFSPCEQSFLLFFLMMRRKGGSVWMASNLWGRRSPNRSLIEWVYTKIQYLSDQCHSLIFYIQFASDLSSSSKLF